MQLAAAPQAQCGTGRSSSAAAAAARQTCAAPAWHPRAAAARQASRRLQAAPPQHVRSCRPGAAAAAGEGAAGGAALQLPTRLNTIPHPREMRQWFYQDVKEGVMRALQAGEKRVLARCTFPELNTEFDVYRVGTLLELVRAIATDIAAANPAATVRVCVQQPLGQGVFAGMPLPLNGVNRILPQMDWGEHAGRIVFGGVGAQEVEGGDAFVLIAPQNIVGHSIIPLLEEMAEAAGAAGKPMVLVNPRLGDIQSAGGVMSVRGRQQRLDFAATFATAYHYRLLYKGVSMYPIMGALRYSWGGEWEVFRRLELGPGLEEYQPIGAFSSEPNPGLITEAFQAAWAAAAKAQ